MADGAQAVRSSTEETDSLHSHISARGEHTKILRMSLQAKSSLELTGATPVVEIVSHPEQLSIDALALLNASEFRNVEFGAKWFALLAKHLFPEDARWLLLRKGDRCQAVWPVQIGEPAGAMSSYYTSLYAPSHSNQVCAADLVELARRLRTGDLKKGVHVFSPMDPESAEFIAMESALQQAGFVTRRFFRFVNWHLPCQGLRWEQYFAERKGALRNTVRRMGKKLTADSGSIEIITGGDRLEAGLAAYEQVYAASWKQAEPYPAFVRDLIVTCAEQGWLRLGVAWLGNTAIAVLDRGEWPCRDF